MNFKNIAIGKKIAMSFSFLLVLLVIIVLLSFFGVGGIVSNAKQVIAGNRLDNALAQREVEHLRWVEDLNSFLTDERITTLEVETDHHKCDLGMWLHNDERKAAERLVPALAPFFEQIEAPHRELHESAVTIGKAFVPVNVHLPAIWSERVIDHLLWAAKIKDAFLKNKDDIDVETDPTKCALGKWMNTGEARAVYEQGDADFRKSWDKLVDLHKKLHAYAVDIKRNLALDQPLAAETKNEIAFSFKNGQRIFHENTLPLLHEIIDIMNELKAVAKQELEGIELSKKIYSSQTLPSLHKVQDILQAIRRTARENIMTDVAILAVARNVRRNVILIGVVAVVCGVLFAFFVPKGINFALKRISGQIEESSIQLASAASQVSSTSQSLATGSSAQAASLEETGSSLEEMSSMINQNASNAKQADTLMKEANKIIDQANRYMTQLTVSMDEISKSSEETSKIIKTIDEIAFQTNLLALNAAVEAARAGEAGAGFAVVADEVRNLAMRAAEAAKNTAALIEGTVKRIDDGSQLVTKTSNAFSEVIISSTKVAELFGEIAAASNEQAQGIDQVNRAVSDMDKVIQNNASTAEENASASEELDAQSQQMKGTVNELTILISGNKSFKKISLTQKEKSDFSHRDPHKSFNDDKSGLMKRNDRHEKLIPFSDDF